MEQPVPTDRIEQERDRVLSAALGTEFYGIEPTEDALEAFESAIREAAMADLQELREAAAEAEDYLLHMPAQTMTEATIVSRIRAALARLEGR
jgi:hypothetical protein